MKIDPNTGGQRRTPWAVLRAFSKPRPVVDRCELCSAELAEDHRHLVEISSRKLLCACDACGVLFSDPGSGRYRRVPRRVRNLSDIQLHADHWASLLIPIGLAFFLRASQSGKVFAIYPSPAGPTEVMLDLDAWDKLVRDNPILNEMEPDTEALLVNRVGPAHECFLVPIDECYKLVGLIRSHWQGFSGGSEVWRAIEQSFSALRERSGSS